MTVSLEETNPHRITRVSLVVGLFLAASLIVVAIAQYPGNARTGPQYLLFGGVAVCVLCALAAWVALRGIRPVASEAALALRQGVSAGVLSGLLWVIEIGFNNLVPPDISTLAARRWVDNGIWGVILIGTVVVGAVGAAHTRRIVEGIRAGFWSGLVSGLFACLMALLLVAVGMRFLLRDPINMQEYAERGATDGAPDMATYFAYQTMAGGLYHLLLLGCVFGVVLGALGGVIGKGVGAARRVREG